ASVFATERRHWASQLRCSDGFSRKRKPSTRGPRVAWPSREPPPQEPSLPPTEGEPPPGSAPPVASSELLSPPLACPPAELPPLGVFVSGGSYSAMPPQAGSANISAKGSVTSASRAA